MTWNGVSSKGVGVTGTSVDFVDFLILSPHVGILFSSPSRVTGTTVSHFMSRVMHPWFLTN